MNLHHINVIVIGHILALTALLLNYFDNVQIGVVFAVLTYAASYFAESGYAEGTNHPKIVQGIGWSSIGFCALSYIAWLTL